ncbi:MAG: heavy metal translocating P-type ATPase [Phycisphaerae bacterium]
MTSVPHPPAGLEEPHDHDHGHDHRHDHGHGHSHGHQHGHDDPRSVAREERQVDFTVVAVLLGGMLLLAAVAAQFLFEQEDHSALIAMAASILLGGPIVYGAGKALWTGKCSHDHDHGDACSHSHSGSHMEELVAIAVLASFATQQYMECAAVAFFMLVASLIEHRTAVGAMKTIESLMRVTPTKARKLLAGGKEEEVDAAILRPGDRVVVLPGDNIPGDGKVTGGVSSVNQASITGESLPVDKTPGDEVFGGSINQSGRLEIEISRAGEDSTLGRTKALLLQASKTRPVFARELAKYSAFYTPVVLMIAAAVFFFTKDIDKAISLLVIACPCALILCGPSALVAGLSASARLGLLVKSVGDLEVVRRVTAFVFDKTGTLTTGDLTVNRLKPAEGIEPAELMKLAVSVERHSRHPVAKAVVAIAEKARVTPAEAEDIHEAAGLGMRANLDGRQVVVGRQAWLKEHGVDVDIDTAEGEGLSMLFVAADGKLVGWLGLGDTVRTNAAEALKQLEAAGVRERVMVTGDRWSSAERIAKQMPITAIHAEALPGDKLALVEGLKEQGHIVCVIGDGVNDGPALAAGHVSIAMGAAGSDVAVNAASVALMNNNLNRLPFLKHVSDRTIKVMRQNLVGSLIYVLGMVVLLGFGFVTPLIAAIGHGLSSIAVVMNSARLVREGEEIPVEDMGGAKPAGQQVKLITPTRVLQAAPATA